MKRFFELAVLMVVACSVRHVEAYQQGIIRFSP